eukprot:6204198-Pleurochrysis_carterae.AAC.2
MRNCASTSLDAFVSSASSTSLGKVSDAGERLFWKERGTPSGNKCDGGVSGGNIDIEQVRHRTLVFHVPTSGQCVDK